LKRLGASLAIAFLLCLPAFAQVQPVGVYPLNGSGPPTITPAVVGGDTTTSDVAATARNVSGQSANSTNTVNTAGATLNLAGGLGRRFFTVVSNTALATKTINLFVNGTLVTLTASAGAPAANQFGPVGTDDTAPQILVTSTALAASITSHATLGPLMTPSVAAGVVYLTKTPTLNQLVIYTGTAGALVTATSGADGQALFADGSTAAPGIALVSSPNTGIKGLGSGGVPGAFQFVLGGVAGALFNGSTQVRFPSNSLVGWSSAVDPLSAVADLLISRGGAGNFRHGAVLDVAAPVAQIDSVQSVVAGTADTAGALRTFVGSVSTGAGSGGPLKRQTSFPGAASTVQNTLSDRDFLGSGWTTLTESTPTAIATLTFGASTSVAALFFVTIQANDATDYQSMSYYVQVNSVRKATGNTVSLPAIIGTPPAVASTSATTLTAAFTVTEGAGAATLNVNAVSSLTQTTLQATFQLIANGAGLTVAPVGF
jgi:hypothetical protein